MEELFYNYENSSLVSNLQWSKPVDRLLSEQYARARITFIKAVLLTKGVSIEESARSQVWSGQWKVPRMVRSGMSGGLEFFLVLGSYKVAVSCMYTMRPDDTNSPILVHNGKKFYLTLNGQPVCDVDLIPQPTYYNLQTVAGENMASIAQQCFSKLAIGVYGNCAFNNNPRSACAFCAIHAAKKTDSPKKSDDDIFETVQAVSDSELSRVIDTIMLGGGTPATADRGAKRFASLSSILTKLVPWRITAMLVPPSTNADLRRLHDSGVKEVSINLEFGSEKSFEQYTPGKAKLVGRRRYYECLEEAVNIFGDYNVQSLLVIGLESPEDALNAVNWLAERRIIPVLSPFRPLPFTLLADKQSPAEDDVLKLYFEAKRIVNDHGMFLGPKCALCQCNTMTLPWDVPSAFSA